MPRYIDADELFRHLNDEIQYGIDIDIHPVEFGTYIGLIFAKSLVEDSPTADVQEVRHGHWEFRCDGAYGRCRCYCSSCGEHSGIGGIRKNQLKPYCPNCGAKMDEEEQK